MLNDLGQLMVAVSCPAGWSSYLSYCYYVSSTATEWSKARSGCLSMNADLVSIDDNNENKFVDSISYVPRYLSHTGWDKKGSP